MRTPHLTRRIFSLIHTHMRGSSRVFVERASCVIFMCFDVTIGKPLSSPLFTQEREDDASRRRAYQSQDEGLSSSLSSSVSHNRTERPVVKPFDSQIPNVREIPSHSSESEQIRILLELADCQAEIRKHEFQADNDTRMLVLQVRKRMQIWGKVLLCASPG